MQHQNSDDPWGFWPDEPTRQLTRTHAGTRSHTDTRLIPVVHAPAARPPLDPHRPHNPLVVRVCAMVGAMLLLVPVALSLRNDHPEVRASRIQGVEPIEVGKLPQPPPTESTLPPTTQAPTTLAVATAAPTVPPTEATAAPTAAPTEAPATAAPPKSTAPKSTAPKTTTPKATNPPTVPPAAVAQTPTPMSCAATYTIARGDTWSGIAARAKVSMKALLAANNATTQSLLLPGKTICLPDGAVTPAPPAPATTEPPTTQPATTQPTTPPVTTVPVVTEPPPPANTFTKAQVAQIIRDVWPDDLEDEAIRIATRESNLIPTAHNSCCYGLFQIYFAVNRTWLAGIGVTSASQLYDPRVNASAALTLYNMRGWAPWAIGTTTTIAA